MIVADEPQPFCIGVISKTQFKVQHNTACSSGGVKQGDLLVTMRKLEPVNAGSSTFVVTDRLLNVHSHCMRLCGIQTENEKRSELDGVLVQGNDKSTGTHTEGQKVKISEETKASIWSSIPQWPCVLVCLIANVTS